MPRKRRLRREDKVLIAIQNAQKEGLEGKDLILHVKRITHTQEVYVKECMVKLKNQYVIGDE